MGKFFAGLGILVVGCILFFFFMGLFALGTYNGIMTMDEAVKTQWAQVDNQLQRRYDLIPNLVETVKGTAAQESKVFLGLAEARKSYFSAQNTADKAVAAGNIESALSRLLMLKEEYPVLKSNESFLKLQDSIEGTENRLAEERRRYNEKVRVLNASIRTFPSSMIAPLTGVSAATYFNTPEEAKKNPQVKL